jgi:hypothetical protein
LPFGVVIVEDQRPAHNKDLDRTSERRQSHGIVVKKLMEGDDGLHLP